MASQDGGQKRIQKTVHGVAKQEENYFQKYLDSQFNSLKQEIKDVLEAINDTRERVKEQNGRVKKLEEWRVEVDIRHVRRVIDCPMRKEIEEIKGKTDTTNVSLVPYNKALGHPVKSLLVAVLLIAAVNWFLNELGATDLRGIIRLIIDFFN